MTELRQPDKPHDFAAKTVWELHAQQCAKTVCKSMQYFLALYKRSTQSTLSHSHTHTDKVPAGHKDLSNQPGYKEQLVVVCVRVRESAAARVIEIDENWLWQIA